MALPVGPMIALTTALDGTVTASTPRPYPLRFPGVPEAAELRAALHAANPDDGWYDDVHGAPDWRAHVTGLLAEEIRQELAW